MKILIPTIGTRGDVQPFIALAQGLNKAGYETILASHPVMQSLVESHQIRFEPVGPDIDLANRVADIRASARSAYVGLYKGMQFGFEMLEKSHDDILRLAREVDLIVVPTAVAAGKNEAELLDLPYLSATLMPWAIPWDDPERTLPRKLLYSAIDRFVHLLTTRPLNRIRKQQGLPPVGKDGFYSPYLNLIPISPEVFEPVPEWDIQHKMVGYWFADDPVEWEAPEELIAFLKRGEPPVLVSLGAMSLGENDASQYASLFVDVFQKMGIRVIIQGWEAGLALLELPSGVFGTGPVPHNWLMPKCAAVIHHGGYGTTAAGFRAGIPALVIPHIADQFYWGQQVNELGVGPEAIPHRKLNEETLTPAINELTQDDRFKRTASELGANIRAETGVENAVQLIQGTFQ